MAGCRFAFLLALPIVPSSVFGLGLRGDVRVLVAVETVVMAVDTDGLSNARLRFRDEDEGVEAGKGRSSMSKAAELVEESAESSSLDSSCFTPSFLTP